MKKKISKKELNKIVGGTAPDTKIDLESALLSETFLKEVEKSHANGTLEADRVRLVGVAINSSIEFYGQNVALVVGPLTEHFANMYINRVISGEAK